MHTILIVDDHAGFRHQARALLEADGFVVIGEAVDGATGLAAARALRRTSSCSTSGCPTSRGSRSRASSRSTDPQPLVVLTSSRDASAFGPRLTAERVLGFIPKDELSGAALRAMLDAA